MHSMIDRQYELNIHIILFCMSKCPHPVQFCNFYVICTIQFYTPICTLHIKFYAHNSMCIPDFLHVLYVHTYFLRTSLLRAIFWIFPKTSRQICRSSTQLSGFIIFGFSPTSIWSLPSTLNTSCRWDCMWAQSCTFRALHKTWQFLLSTHQLQNYSHPKCCLVSSFHCPL